ncbi:MAG: UDP-2,3-diacylglucosamine diphosphatase [Robiginitalea sp.]|nr:UDP-2,3-diacylglucosamine diphosphatase [Robiginitalea sp.]
MKKRPVELVVISDVHLGTYGCHAKELCRYMKSIRPETVILNGDIIDVWQFSKRYWPKSHMKVVKILVEWISNGVPVYYVTGNHDEMLRKFVGFQLAGFSIVNKVVLELDGKKAWAFHGDVFDVTMKHSKWLAKLGAVGYDSLILLNKAVNYFGKRLGRGPISMSKRIKNSVKSAVKFINNFEETAVEIARENDFDYVVCGHIHQPEIRDFQEGGKQVTYLNSGDWVENLTSLEYNKGSWRLYHYMEDVQIHKKEKEPSETEEILDAQVLFEALVREMQIR